MPNPKPGRPFEAEVNSSDASSGVAIPIYESGAATSVAYTLLSREYLEVDFVHFITVAGGACEVLIGADATSGVNEQIIAGTYAANGGFAGELGSPKVGVVGGTLWVVAPAGVADVQIRGRIRTLDDVGTKASWKAADRGQ
jgi:hypothetical protein